MGIELSDNVAYYLNTREKRRTKRLETIRTKAAKLKKNKRKFDKLKEATAQAKKEFHKRQGTYKKGMNMDDPYGDIGSEDKPPPRKKSKVYCEYCGHSNHVTKKSKKCTAPLEPHKKFRKQDGTLLTEPPADPVVDPSDLHLLDCHNLDTMTFDADYDSSDENLIVSLEKELSEGNSNTAKSTGKQRAIL
jgi:hypothetical protein